MTDLMDGQVEEQDQTAEASEGCGSEGPNSHPCPVVAIGASAGGLEAFQELFRRMPADTGFAFVLIQHLSPRHETLIPELLAPLTPMPVRTVEDETVIEANQIYVMPPHGTLTIDDCVLYLSKPARIRGRRSPIDRFFRSLAEDQEDEAVAIVLSGTGTDGTLGLKAVKERGGLTLVQAPETARYDSMPRGAVLTGAADHILAVEQMPARLVEHQKRLRDGQGGSPSGSARRSSGYLGKICAILRRVTGHDFRHYKQSTLVRRVRRRMTESRSASVYDYVESLNNGTKEVEQLFRDLLISVTHFFRDPEAFDLLAAKVIPRLFEGKDADGFVRVWVPGCATGEEAYSLAILLREHMAALDRAAAGADLRHRHRRRRRSRRRGRRCYPEGIADQISPERLERFFVRHGNMLPGRASEIRDMCLFSLHNLIADPPFSRLDLVSCRNLLIYLEGDLQKKVIALFHYALRPGGFLFLGPSEIVAGQPELFRTIDKKHRIFQSRDTVSRPPFSFPLSEPRRLGIRRSRGSAAAAPAPRQRGGADLRARSCSTATPRPAWWSTSGATSSTSRRARAVPRAAAGDADGQRRRHGAQGAAARPAHGPSQGGQARGVPVVHENVAFELDGGHAAGQHRRAPACRSWARIRGCSWSSSRTS